VSLSLAPIDCCVEMLASSSLSSCHFPTPAGASVTRSGSDANVALSGSRRSRVGRTGFALSDGTCTVRPPSVRTYGATLGGSSSRGSAPVSVTANSASCPAKCGHALPGRGCTAAPAPFSRPGASADPASTTLPFITTAGVRAPVGSCHR
jgi:hypothetical protein